MTLKYAIHPNFVVSKTDGDFHYIPANRLAYLYGLRTEQYMVINDSDDRHEYAEAMRRAEELNLIHLSPRFDGNYQLPV